MLLFILLSIIALLYQVQWIFLARGLWKQASKKAPSSISLPSGIVLIVHRNEPEALKNCLISLGRSNWEIYVLDDHSDVKHRPVLEELSLQLGFKLVFSEAMPGKKSALAWFLPQRTESYIIQTDADCIVDDNFISGFQGRIQASQADLIVGRVAMQPSANIWSKLAALDHMSLQLVTFSGLKQDRVIMAAGAAMAYNRERFISELPNHMDWASGEDTFYAQALDPKKGEVIAAPEVGVLTKAPENLSSFIRQRLRWGGKSIAYRGFWPVFLALSVVLVNLTIVIGVFLSFGQIDYQLIWYFWLYKISGDAILLYQFSQSYGGEKLLKGYLTKALLYPFYILLIILLVPFSSRGKWLRS